MADLNSRIHFDSSKNSKLILKSKRHDYCRISANPLEVPDRIPRHIETYRRALRNLHSEKSQQKNEKSKNELNAKAKVESLPTSKAKEAKSKDMQLYLIESRERLVYYTSEFLRISKILNSNAIANKVNIEKCLAELLYGQPEEILGKPK